MAIGCVPWSRCASFLMVELFLQLPRFEVDQKKESDGVDHLVFHLFESKEQEEDQRLMRYKVRWQRGSDC